MTAVAPKPLFRDPILDGAADPTLIWNVDERTWWMVYTNRRATGPMLAGSEWMHGTDLGVASSSDGGLSWTYRGVLDGLDTEWGRHTYWAPEIVHHGAEYHMYVSYIRGVPGAWEGVERHIRHYTSEDLAHWTFQSTLDLGSSAVIDAAVVRLPEGGWRMWFKDEADANSTWSADSPDLSTWTVSGRAVGGAPHEGPNVFRLGGSWWMLVDEWHGQRVLHSDDLVQWTRHGLILDQPGSGTDDATVGLHADVVVTGALEASVFYFTHPERTSNHASVDTPATRRTSIQVARLRVSGGTLVCDRDEAVDGPLPLDGGPTS